MFHVVLYEPEIPANTGNIGRLCVATGCKLHLVGQPGFRLDDRSVRRAGLDYWEHVELHRHVTLPDFVRDVAPGRMICLSAHAKTNYTSAEFHPGDALVFGSESRGLPDEVLSRYAEQTYTIPMLSDKVRSLNLACAVGIVVYEALRQTQEW